MKRKKNYHLFKQKVSIIAGDFRHRKISFLDLEQLRPTSARTRETLFDWLQADTYGAKCLDLFSGSGILGFESLSRGANHVTFVDKNGRIAKQISDNCKLLNIDMMNKAVVLHADYSYALQDDFDIVFVDPPYALRILPEVLDKIKTLAVRYIYIEDDQPFEHWIKEMKCYDILKSKKAGGVYYGLLSPYQA